LWYNIIIEFGKFGINEMDNQEFSQIRAYLQKTQKEMGQLLCVSPKAIQSYEQGWRPIPAGIQRQIMFLAALKKSLGENNSPCWEIRNCPDSWRKRCSAWEFGAGHFCWVINGTFCHGMYQDNWETKIQLCRECEVYKSMLPNDYNQDNIK
jgi:hypothetical protein